MKENRGQTYELQGAPQAVELGGVVHRQETVLRRVARPGLLHLGHHLMKASHSGLE